LATTNNTYFLTSVSKQQYADTDRGLVGCDAVWPCFTW
jgi:hypothetical protein